MASGLCTLSSSITRNLSQCIKHSINSTHHHHPQKEVWKSIASLSFHAGFLDDTYQDVKEESNVRKTLDLYTLKEKEKGDWRHLTLQEKQALYHMSFSQPLCDVEQQADEWKLILAGAFTTMGLMTLGLYMWLSQLERTESDIVGPLSLKVIPAEKEMIFSKKL